MEIPRVDPIGILERPAESAERRPASRRARVLAAILLALFTFATVVTTVVSAGAYCLTTEPGDVRTLPQAFRPGTPAGR